MRTTTSRPIPLALTALIAFFSALTALAVSNGHDAHAHELAPTAAITPKELALRNGMRALWEDHVTWTRLAIVTFADGSAGFDATAARLLKNQRDIGDAIAPFYGTAAGNRLAALLHDHITIAVEVLKAAKAGDTAANARWYANANDIGDLLAAANPRSWPKALLCADMKTHLDQTLTVAAHELGGQYAASVTDYEPVHAHILMMADLLSRGIIAQFPSHFR